ncbi:hypothetical protein SDC9_58511 [bioreactor metagenome]|uniref:Uncharacterized protein n=1 Tax=bioreactor metagenome TaxID=1076179 RepID=A0A644X7V7_9ZZZZ
MFAEIVVSLIEIKQSDRFHHLSDRSDIERHFRLGPCRCRFGDFNSSSDHFRNGVTGLLQFVGIRTKSICRDELRTGFDVLPMNPAQQLGIFQIQRFRILACFHPVCLEHRTHRSIEEKQFFADLFSDIHYFLSPLA